MRTFVLVALCALPAAAQGITGSFSASFVGFDQFNVTTTRLTLSLQCQLTCSAGNTLKFGGGTINASFVSAPSERTGYITSAFEDAVNPTGMATVDNTSFKPGSAFTVRTAGANCSCGSQSATITLITPQVVIPPLVTAGPFVNLGQEHSVTVDASPRGAETVSVRIVGGGLDTTLTRSPSDFTSTPIIVRYTPTAAGKVTVTATLLPYGEAKSIEYDVRSDGSQGGGGGSSATGGGGNASGGGGAQSGGCSTADASLGLFLMLAIARRRTHPN